MAAAPPCGGLFRCPGAKAVATYNPSAMTGTPLPDLILYGRPGCGLCDETRELLRALLDQRAAASLPTPTLQEIDIEADPAIERAFLAIIPVVELGDRRIELATSAARLRRLLADVLDGAATTA
jgi:glutaredoxin